MTSINPLLLSTSECLQALKGKRVVLASRNGLPMASGKLRFPTEALLKGAWLAAGPHKEGLFQLNEVSSVDGDLFGGFVICVDR